MKTTKFITGLILCGSIFAACSSDDDQGKGMQSGDPAKVTISIANPMATYALTGTEEDGTQAENTVSVIEIYAFDDQGVADTKVGNNGYFSAKIPAGTTATTFRYTVIMSSGNKKKLVAAVNMNLGALATGQTYANLKDKLSNAEFKAPGATGNNARIVPTNGFEMSGEIEADIVSGTVNSVRIPVSRLVSKINAPKFKSIGNVKTTVSLTDKEKEMLWGTGANAYTITFKELGYAVINGINKSNILFSGRLADNDDTNPKGNKPWVDWKWDGKSYLNSSFDPSGNYTNTYSGQSNSGGWFLTVGGAPSTDDCVYVYENKPKTVSVNNQNGFDPKSVCAFILKGELVVNGDTNNANGLNKIHYWRVDLVRSDNSHILRNNSYHVYIKTITSTGFPTEKEAEEDPDIVPDADDTSAQVEIVVNRWRVNQSETII
jgi:hypothetical protein